ncbi:hypothetical protein BOTBODRAFT_188630 [Botryobasidium botryosum FD-172 SS1]|uniref:Uncharacterized protein n=1 Tax=Botryobasidium botryosum (strain FD-172 SS1) TaxID=930990 RepID=A0A067MFD8_BOTB1|nr:hypothetical protein BOTBODRAFT_188630 [Botryobasidium botryosum FD-172 SS1]
MRLGDAPFLFLSVMLNALFSRADFVGSSSVKCGDASNGWSENARGQTPCLVYADLYSACANKTINVPELSKSDPNATYPAPSDDLGCLCNTVVYDLISACALCQSKAVISWPQWAAKCEPNSTLVGRFPQPTPDLTEIPNFAYWDPTGEGIFNFTAAQSYIPQNTTGTSTSSGPGPSASASPDSGNGTDTSSRHGHGGHGRNTVEKSTSLGAIKIVGGVLGGVLGLVLILLLICAYRRYQQSRKQADCAVSTANHESTSAGFPIVSPLEGPSAAPTIRPDLLYAGNLPVISRIYDPADPSTFPPNPTDSYTNFILRPTPPPSYEPPPSRDSAVTAPEMAHVRRGTISKRRQSLPA